MRSVLLIIAIIAAVALVRAVDFNALRFEKPGLGIVYLLVFIIAAVLWVRDRRKTGHSDI